MCTTDSEPLAGPAFGSPANALRTASAALDYINATTPDGSACGDLLITLGEVQAKLTAAHAGLLRRFDVADAHDADGYGSSSSWLAAKAGMSKKAARAAVREMRQLGERPLLGDALAAGDITGSLAFTIADWTRKLPGEMRTETDRILLAAAASGASLDDLNVIAACAIEKWRQQQPDPDDPEPDPADRCLQLGVTFGGAAVLRGNLTPECATAVRAVLEALGKKAGPEDTRTEAQRFHDALQLACTLLLRARLVPDRTGADTQAIVHMPLSALRELAGAAGIEDTWIRARLGEDGYLTGQDAETASCDAQTVPVVTGNMDPPAVDKMIGLAQGCSQPLSPEAWQALRYAMMRLAVDLVSGRPVSLRRCGGGSLRSRGTRRACHSTSGTPGQSRGTSGAQWCCATGTAHGPGAGAQRCTATCTTCGTRATAARLRWLTACWYASSTMTCASTGAAGS